MFFGNARTLELHVVTCQWWPQLASARKVPFFTIADAIARAYNGCRSCLPHRRQWMRSSAGWSSAGWVSAG
ncbi:hypothetical protein ACPW96_05205 [Micromonospora sp. DT81.3]|uniref:hypothetical protein n=1 Tax=Micromonospora sp. DT81.3 TaxID=3416523 RepID=UPI003CFA248D